MELKNRYEFMLLVEAENCNPNGDPDMGNLPRQDPDTGYGYITDAALKRRIRNYVMDAYGDKPGMDIFAKNGTSINREILDAFIRSDDEKKNGKNISPAEVFCQRYWDGRTFGGVLSTGKNAGQIRGTVQLAFAKSADPIDPQNITVTRMYYTEGNYNTLEEFDNADAKMSPDKKRTMGTKQFIPYGLYIVKGTVSANLARKNGFSEEDLGILFEALLQMYNNDASSSKTGMSVVSPLIIFKHVGVADQNNDPKQKEKEAMLGCCGAHKLFDLLHVSKKEDVDTPRAYSDYETVLDISNVPAGVEVGIKDNPFDKVTWGADAVKNLNLDDIAIK
ncbi:MAG TPA: type I-C CRISPR-associated protein Cas7/Csd2 [Lachnospiraceae bacterium]|jgi:CRISPR-associated protein Csd2|nr:type I-C CRISPR-associated protein Cas7/Csd2 [Lachnospiraceae bacterium]